MAAETRLVSSIARSAAAARYTASRSLRSRAADSTDGSLTDDTTTVCFLVSWGSIPSRPRDPPAESMDVISTTSA